MKYTTDWEVATEMMKLANRSSQGRVNELCFRLTCCSPDDPETYAVREELYEALYSMILYLFQHTKLSTYCCDKPLWDCFDFATEVFLKLRNHVDQLAFFSNENRFSYIYKACLKKCYDSCPKAPILPIDALVNLIADPNNPEGSIASALGSAFETLDPHERRLAVCILFKKDYYDPGLHEDCLLEHYHLTAPMSQPRPIAPKTVETHMSKVKQKLKNLLGYPEKSVKTKKRSSRTSKQKEV